MNGYQMRRGWLAHSIFDKDEAYDQRSAWCWLIESAVWCPTRINSILLQRGQLSFSLRFLAQKWMWHKSKVERFIKRLKAETMIETHTETGTMVITICNYNQYQLRPTVTETPSETLGETKKNITTTTTNIQIGSVSPSVECIAAFDAAISEIWGSNLSRLAPTATDRLTAEEWLKAGIPLSFCKDHFRDQMLKMRKKGKPPPRSLRFFDESLRSSFTQPLPTYPAQLQRKPDTFQDEDHGTAIWRARAKDWFVRKTWLQQWGDPPGTQSCQCPADILKAVETAAAVAC